MTTASPAPRRTLRTIALRVGLPLLGILIAVGVWALALAWLFPEGSIQSRLNPGDGIATLVDATVNGDLVEHALTSLRRILAGLLLAAAIGIPIGLALGIAPLLARGSSGVFGMMRNISPLAWTPVAIIFLGVGDAPVVFLIAIGAVWPIMLSTQAGVSNLDPTWLRVSRSLGATRWETVRHVIWPGVRPNVLTGVRIATGLAWVILVPAEMFGVDSGLGFFLLDARDRFRMDELIAVMIAIGLLGLAIDALTSRLLGERRRRAGRTSRSGQPAAPAGGTAVVGAR